MVWHDQFKTAVLANAATGDWSDGVMENWNNGPQGFLPINPTLHQSITPFPAAFGNLLGIVGPEDTDISTLKPDITAKTKKAAWSK